MLKFTYLYEELPMWLDDLYPEAIHGVPVATKACPNGFTDILNLEATVCVDPYDHTEWHFEDIKISKYMEDEDDWYIVTVYEQTEPLMRAVHRLFQDDHKLRFSLEEEINEHVDGIRDRMLEQLGKDKAKGLQ